jgi:hypothetical protein
MVAMRASVVVGEARKIWSSACCASTGRTLSASSGGQSTISITHQHHRRGRVALTEFAHDHQRAVERHAALERTFAGFLDDRTIGHRIGKGHPQLNQVGAALDQRMQDAAHPVRMRIASGHERNQAAAACGLELGHARFDARAHSDMPSRFAIV